MYARTKRNASTSIKFFIILQQAYPAKTKAVEAAILHSSMLCLSERLLNRPVMSLRTGQAIATTTQAIINPDNLKIEGFYCTDRFDKSTLVLLYQDIRDVVAQGIVVNDHDALTDPKDLVRLKHIFEIDYEVIGKRVVSTSGTRLGKVSDYAVEAETMYIQKLYVSRSILKDFAGGGLGIARDQVQEMTDKKIIVSDPLESGTVQAGAVA
ncbi:MAG: hypothetical protein QG629_312 [Patescibacteria group bacterium]|nr:hypothetical protein [Patescibacteria group bacterium]